MQDTSSNALTVTGVHKNFILPHDRKSTIKERIIHLNKPQYETFHALNDISFEVKKGEFFGIVGRNGSGKSTLLKLIGGIYQPTRGEIRVNGTLTPFIELGIGFNPELTGKENVFLNGAILGLSRKEVKSKYHEIVQFAELEKFMDQKLKNYSSGMQIRLAFSIAIQAHNDILLIDEVLAVGDANFQKKCFSVFEKIKKQGKTVIFVTHDMGAVEQYCDRAMMIQDSKVKIIGSPREVSLRYEMANMSQSKQEATSPKPKPLFAKINSIKLHGAQLKTKSFNPREKIEIEVSFTAKEIKPVQLNLYFIDQQGRNIGGINTTGDLGQFNPKVGENTVNCHIEPGQFNGGTYRVNAALYEYGDNNSKKSPELYDIFDYSYSDSVPTMIIKERSKVYSGDFIIKSKWISGKD